MKGKFGPVEIDQILRSVVITAEDNLGEVFVREHLIPDEGCKAVGLIEIIAVDFQHDGGAAAHSATFGNGSLLDFRIFLEIFPYDFGDFRG